MFSRRACISHTFHNRTSIIPTLSSNDFPEVHKILFNDENVTTRFNISHTKKGVYKCYYKFYFTNFLDKLYIALELDIEIDN